MTPAAWGQLAVKVIILWTVLSVLFLVFVWPHLAGRMDAIQAERERRARIKRLEKVYEQSTRIIIDEEIARECAQYEEDLEREASAILARLDDEARANFQAAARKAS